MAPAPPQARTTADPRTSRALPERSKPRTPEARPDVRGRDGANGQAHPPRVLVQTERLERDDRETGLCALRVEINGHLYAVRCAYEDHPCAGTEEMLIGMDILKKLHLYIAFEENKLYISEATAPSKPTETAQPQP